MPAYFNLKMYKQSKEFPMPKEAAIILEKIGTDSDGHHILGGKCVNTREVVEQADAMIAELERVKKKAQSFFK